MEISTVIGLIFLLAAAFYLFVQLGLIVGLKRLKHPMSEERPFVSIIVAARNEEKNISRLLECLTHQAYLQYEIIIVNDRSTDNTARFIDEFQKHHSNITRIDIASLPDDMPAKKNALRTGIEASKGEILCFTDADCTPPPHWIEEIVKSFDPTAGIVTGYSPYQIPKNNTFQGVILDPLLFKFIGYEEFRAAIWAAGSIGWNLGWLCTGRNLAYRRKVYDEVHGFESIKMSISGDDDLFLQLVRRQTAWKIHYVTTRESVVLTVPPANFRSFVGQRTRHFSAAKFFTVPMMLFFFFYHSSNLSLLLSPLLFLLNVLPLSVTIAGLCAKLAGDIVLFNASRRTFEASRFRRSFILMEALYILYNSLIGPLGLFKKFTWKQN